LLCGLLETDGGVKLGFNGDLYPSAGATSVMTTKGDMVDYDSARQRLGIGSANQILQVKSSLPSWETVDLADTVLTTAGDVLYENATPELARLPKGTQYNNLQMGSALPAWSASTTSVLTGAMDILYSSSANTLARLSAGTNNDVLTTHGTGSAPTWETPSAGSPTFNIQRMDIDSDDSTTSTSLVDSDLTLTTSNTSGSFTVSANMTTDNSVNAGDSRFAYMEGTTAHEQITGSQNHTGGYYSFIGLGAVGTCDGDEMVVQFSTGSGTVTIQGSETTNSSNLEMLEIS